MEKILKLYIYQDGVNDKPFPNAEQQVVTSAFRSDYKRMGGAPTLSCTIHHPLCLDKLWTYNVYALFNGERFFIKQIPSSSYSNTDARYKHEVELVSERIILDNVYVYDVVDKNKDDDKPVSNSSNFTFFGTISEFAERLNESLKYSGLDYRVVVDEGITSEAKMISFQDQFFSNAIQESYNVYGIPYYFVGKEIHIGFTNNDITHIFKYGKNDSLLSINKQNANIKLVNRITGVGSADNIPYYYPNSDERGEVDILYNGESGLVSLANRVLFRNLKLTDTLKYVHVDKKQVTLFESLDYTLGRYDFHFITDEFGFSTNEMVYDANITYSFKITTRQPVKLDITGFTDGEIGGAQIYSQGGGYNETFQGDVHIEKEFDEGVYTVNVNVIGRTTFDTNLGLSPSINDTDMRALINQKIHAHCSTTQSGYSEWEHNGRAITLDKLGLKTSQQAKNGDSITLKVTSYVIPQTNLMPPVYRETSGSERFYNALNDTYLDKTTGKYYHFDNPFEEGKPKEHIVKFDDIKPSIVGMKNRDGLRIDMFSEFAFDLDDNDETDESGEYLHPYFFGKLRKFDGDFGFNLFEHAIEEDEMVISMTSGSCGACNFVIGVDNESQMNLVQVDDNGKLLRDNNGNVRCGREGMQAERPQQRQNNTRDYEVWVALKKDIDTFGVIMPNASSSYRPSTEDTFVILHIDLPKAYILAAEERLKEELIKYMHQNNNEKFNFSVTFSRIFFAENPQVLERLNENAKMKIEYNGELYELYVSSFSYSMATNDVLPEIRVELKDTLTIAQNALQTAISEVKADIISNLSSVDWLKQGMKYFLRKDKDDATPNSLGVGKNINVGLNATVGRNLSIGGNIKHKNFAEGTQKSGYAIQENYNGEYEAEVDNVVARILSRTYDLLVEHNARIIGDMTSEEFISGFLAGKGWAIQIKEIINAAGVAEKKSVAEFDDLIVRGSMRVYEFIVSQMLGENDNRIFTGMMEVDHYDASDGKIYLKTENGKLYNPFRVNDIIIVQQYGGIPTEGNDYYVTKQYEFIVTGVGIGSEGENRLDWVTFRNFTTTMAGGDVSLIQERDTLVRIDNLFDVNRKGIIQLMSVGENTPYIDFIHGAKTDPEHSLKGRIGNLGGIYNPLFGWLKDFGAYLANIYAVGEFRIAHSGADVADLFEITKGQFRTNYKQTTYDMSEEQNFFTNASMTNNCENWVLDDDSTEFFMVDGLPQFFNRELYASEENFAGLAEWRGRDMLRLMGASITQSNELIRKPEMHKEYVGATENEDGSFTENYEEVLDTLYLTVRFYAAKSGHVEFGFYQDGEFVDNDLHYSEDVTSREDGYEIKLSGTWEGFGDFRIVTDGDIYIDLLSLTDKPLDNFKITTETRIEQDAQRISLLGTKVNGVEGSVTQLGIELNAAEERITLYIDKEIEGVNKSITNLGIELNAAEERITVYVDKEIEGVGSTVSQLTLEVGNISTKVAKVEGSVETAQKAADAAKNAADAAGVTATNAQNKANANATAISQNADYISTIAVAFETDEEGNLVLDENGSPKITSSAGSVVTAEMAKLYATKATVDSLTNKVNTNTTSISTTNQQLTALAEKITTDKDGNITNISTSGLVLESNFASLFSTQVTKEGLAKKAEIRTVVQEEVAKIELTADQIDINGVVSANNYFKINTDGSMEVNTGKITGKLTVGSNLYINGAADVNQGIYYSNTTTSSDYFGELSFRPRMTTTISRNSLTEENNATANVLLYLDRSRGNMYDRTIYAKGISEFNGRVAISSINASNTTAEVGKPALFVEGGIGLYGSFHCEPVSASGSVDALTDIGYNLITNITGANTTVNIQSFRNASSTAGYSMIFVNQTSNSWTLSCSSGGFVYQGSRKYTQNFDGFSIVYIFKTVSGDVVVGKLN